ncbi:hypothetical protein [Parasitella parasitica]|uniref:Uncharacterized protein n=1 Tax=Parasitella parasitica TaxID=35722 RepID=A0A0B7N039_9FUNG|nr:hypothetical protein [Parasitella parasitica]
MDIVNQQQHHYENTKEMLMKRLADASQYKIYPSIIPRNELPLRKILLTTRLWNHVRRQQAVLAMSSASDEWLFDQEISNNIIPVKEEEKQVEEIQEKIESYNCKRKIEDEPEQLQIKKLKPSSNTNNSHQHFIDSPASPAGPATVSSATPTSLPSPTNNSPTVLLSA